MNNPLNTIFKSENKIKLKTILEAQTRPFPNNKINRIQVRYQTVFSRIMDIFSKSIFYNKEFLPRMNQRKKFMKINNKIFGKRVEPLTQEEFEEQKKKLQINNTYDEYSSRQDIPLFTYITNDPDQFENWSAIKIFEWWRSLRMSGIPKGEWNVFDAVKYLFINQFMRIMNSYLKYGVHKRDEFAFIKLQEYLRLVDVFYENRGQYQYLLDAHLAFCEWFSARFIGGLLFESGRNNDKKYVNSSIYIHNKNKEIKLIRDYFNLTIENNSILLIPLSFFQKESNFINIYAGPLIVFLGINYRTHIEASIFNKLYSPYGQISHDIISHSMRLINFYKIIVADSEILLFEERCKFLTIVSLTENDEFKKLLWYILHENPTYFFTITSIESFFTNTSMKSFFNISILFIKLNEIINIKTINNKNNKYILTTLFKKYSINAIYTLICTCIVFFMSNFLPLEYFKELKITVESIVFIHNVNNISNKVIKISNREKQLIEFEYDVKRKQLKLHSLSDYNLLKGVLELQSKGVLIVHNPDCFESYLLSPNTIQVCEILSGYAFFNNVFLPKMRERVAKNRVIMRVNNKKFSKLLKSNFQTKQFELEMKTNSFNKYQERYDTPLFTYIYEDKDQFENWSAIKIFEWWRNLRTSGTKFSTFTKKIFKREWPVFDAVKYLFINQILHILNSYRKYDITDERHLAYRELQQYLQLVDVFYTRGGQYQYLLDAHLAYCEWFSARFIGGLLFERSQSTYVNSKKYNNRSKNYKNLRESAIKQLIEMFAQSLTDNNYILIIPLSYSQKESKILNTYSGPFIPFLGINYRTHEDVKLYYLNYSPKNQITHDFAYHSKLICSSYSQLYQNKNYSDIRLFSQRCKFLTIVSLIDNDDLKKLLWYILHEIFFFNETEINFFNFNILFEKLNKQETYKILQPVFYDEIKLTQSIYTLICACIIFFMFQSFSLKGISQISIKINGLITTVSLYDTLFVRLEINLSLKQVKIIYLNKDVSSLSDIKQQIDWKVIDSQQNSQQNSQKHKNIYKEQMNMYKKQIGNIYTKIGQLQHAQPNL